MKFSDLDINVRNIRSFDLASDIATTVIVVYRDDEGIDVSARVDADPDVFRALGMHFLAQAHGLTVHQRDDFADVDLLATTRFITETNIAHLPRATQERVQAMMTDIVNLLLAAAESVDADVTGDSVDR